MRFVMTLAAAAFACLFLPAGEAQAQSLQCRQQITPEQRELCAEREIDDLDDMVKYWRSAARQSQRDYDYFANRRQRCNGDLPCIARELQTEISELQVQIEPAARIRVSEAYTGPVVQQSAATTSRGAPTDLDRAMDRIIQRDSWDWQIDRYDRGSVRNTRLERTVGQTRIVYAEYTFNRGTPGWMRLHLSENRIECVEYHNLDNQCRSVPGTTHSSGSRAQLLAAAATSALTSY